MHLRQPGLRLGRLCQAPTVQVRAHSFEERKALLARQRQGGLNVLPDGLGLAAVVMEARRLIPGDTQAEGVRALVRQRQGLAAALLGLLRIAQEPEDNGQIVEAPQPRVLTVEEGMAVMLLSLVACQPLL